MPRESYQEQLNSMRTAVLDMGDVVTARLRLALDAMAAGDETAARDVIAGDDEINDIYLDLEQECIDLLALQQPVAGDLRLIAASFKILTDLERVGDLAVNLAEYTPDAQRGPAPDVDVEAIGDLTVEMVRDAMAAYDARDEDACYDIAERDDRLDEHCARASQSIVRELIETELEGDGSEDRAEALMQDVSRLLLTVRDLERIGDHAVNIAARTLYMVENDEELIY